jgi:uncharacterized membrane protein HdeD (DUF308 family)
VATRADTADVKSASLGLILAGLILAVLGIVVLAWPDITAKTLVILFGIFLLIQGAASILAALVGLTPGHRLWAIVVGLIAIGFGIACLFATDVAGRTLLFIIGAFAIVRGIIDLVGAVAIKEGRGTLILGGAINLIFGLIMVAKPEGGALILIALVGAFFIFSGLAMIAFGIAMRGEAKALTSE